MKDLKMTNRLLLVMVVALCFYLLKVLSFIFVPLVFSMFIALLFLPLMRWLRNKGIPRILSIVISLIVFAGVIFIGVEVFALASREIRNADPEFFVKAKDKIAYLITSGQEMLGMEVSTKEAALKDIAEQFKIMDKLGGAFGAVSNLLSMTLTTIFFTVLWLAESINVQKLLQDFVIRNEFTSVKTFMKIESELITFVKVKFLVSLFTGIGFSLACLAFDVSFPIFWGLFAFLINFVQMIGSIISVVCLAIFALVELDPTGTLLVFVLVITGVQALFGGIVEPVMMGKSFSINVIAILVMLMFWGFIWGIPGMIMSIPITVFIKIILDEFPNTKKIGSLLSGPEIKSPIKLKK